MYIFLFWDVKIKWTIQTTIQSWIKRGTQLIHTHVVHVLFQIYTIYLNVRSCKLFWIYFITYMYILFHTLHYTCQLVHISYIYMLFQRYLISTFHYTCYFVHISYIMDTLKQLFSLVGNLKLVLRGPLRYKCLKNNNPPFN